MGMNSWECMFELESLTTGGNNIYAHYQLVPLHQPRSACYFNWTWPTIGLFAWSVCRHYFSGYFGDCNYRPNRLLQLYICVVGVSVL